MHKLLLADDSVTIQRVIELTFSGEDVQVVAVNDGEQAIARIPIERPDIVLADIAMPKRSGYDVAAFVKGRPDLAQTPVLLLAGAFEPVDQARAEQVQCDGVLIKPFEPRQVIARVRELIDAAKARASVVDEPVRPVERLTPREPSRSAGAELHAPIDISPVVAPAPAQREAPADTVAPAVSETSPEPAPPVVLPAASPVEPPVPPVRPSAPGPAASIDEYLDRLNIAFTSLGKVESPASSAASSGMVPPPEPPAVAAVDGAPASGVAAPPSTTDDAFPPVDSLDDYFERLNAAFASGPSGAPGTVPASPPAQAAQAYDDSTLLGADDDGLGAGPDEHLPTIAELVGDDDLGHTFTISGEPDVPERRDAASLPRFDSPAPLAGAGFEAEFASPSSLAEAFGALLSDDADDEFGTPLSTRDGGLPVDDELVDRVTRRVLDRLAPEVALRLRQIVREELQKVGTRR